MEHSLLNHHNLNLTEGIPYQLIHHLSRGSRYYDANIDCDSAFEQDLREINSMEKKLGQLSREQLDLRVIADFCCIWRYDYPSRVTQICGIIGGNSNTALRLHYQVSPSRRLEFIQYAEALKAWLEGVQEDGDSGEIFKKVYRFLGEKDKLKELLVERTYLGLSYRFLNCSFWGRITGGDPVSLLPCFAQELPENWKNRMGNLERKIRSKMGSSASSFLCAVGGSSEPACHFKFMRRIDILISSIGVLEWRGNLPPKDRVITGRRKLTKACLNVLENFWKGHSLPARDGEEKNIEIQILPLLGEPTEFKKWLVACLWKNIKNQTQFHSYPMKRWLEFVRIGEKYLDEQSG